MISPHFDETICPTAEVNLYRDGIADLDQRFTTFHRYVFQKSREWKKKKEKEKRSLDGFV